MIEKLDTRKGSIEAKDPLGASIPGMSLTSDNKKWAWGNPPIESDPKLVLEQAVDRFEDSRFKEDVFKLLLAGVSVEHLVETWVIDGFENGKFSLDTGLIAKGQLGVYIAYLAEQENIDYRMFERDDIAERDRVDDESFFKLMKENNPKMFEVLRESVNETLRKGN